MPDAKRPDYKINIRSIDGAFDSVAGISKGQVVPLVEGDAFAVVALQRADVTIKVTGKDKALAVQLLTKLLAAIPSAISALKDSTEEPAPPTAPLKVAGKPKTQSLTLPISTEALTAILKQRGFEVSKDGAAV